MDGPQQDKQPDPHVETVVMHASVTLELGPLTRGILQGFLDLARLVLIRPAVRLKVTEEGIEPKQ